MADEFQFGSGNWWDSSRNRYESGSTTSSTTLNSTVSYGWPTEMVEIKASSSMDSASDSASSIVFQDTHNNKLQRPDSSGGVLSADPNLQMIGLGLSPQNMDSWNQTLFRGEKAESSYGRILQEDLNTNFQQGTRMSSSQEQWREKIYSRNCEDNSMNEFKQINPGLALDQPQYSSHISSNDTSTITCQGLPSSFQMDSTAMYTSPSTILQGLFVSDNQQQHQSNYENRSMNYSYPSSYGMNSTGEVVPSWSKDHPQFLRNSLSKQLPPHGQLHFSNNAPFWNASTAAMNDVRPSFFPSLPPQFQTTTFDEKPKQNMSEVREVGTLAKKSNSESSNKRPRNETQSPLPAFKARKEKMGDRITALQQLVSPFGKTDTASVLSEVFEYIKYLHGQVSVLSGPYMKSGPLMQHHQQNTSKSNDTEGHQQDLRSRGLCLVPVSITFPVTHETIVDFWTPTYGGTYH